MHEPLFKRRRTYLILLAFFIMLAAITFRQEFGLGKAKLGVVSPSEVAQKVDESDNHDYKFEEAGDYKVFKGTGVELYVPKLWGAGVILYRPSEPNIILAMSNSVDLGASNTIPVGMVKGKLQFSTRQYAVEFEKVSESDFWNEKSSFWSEREKTLESQSGIKVAQSKKTYGQKEFIEERVEVKDSKMNVDATQMTFYRLLPNARIVALSWDWEGVLNEALLKEIETILEKLVI